MSTPALRPTVNTRLCVLLDGKMYGEAAPYSCLRSLFVYACLPPPSVSACPNRWACRVVSLRVCRQTRTDRCHIRVRGVSAAKHARTKSPTRTAGLRSQKGELSRRVCRQTPLPYPSQKGELSRRVCRQTPLRVSLVKGMPYPSQKPDMVSVHQQLLRVSLIKGMPCAPRVSLTSRSYLAHISPISCAYLSNISLISR